MNISAKPTGIDREPFACDFSKRENTSFSRQIPSALDSRQNIQDCQGILSKADQVAVQQNLCLEIKQLNKRIRLERTASFFCLCLQLVCVAWMQVSELMFVNTNSGNHVAQQKSPAQKNVEQRQVVEQDQSHKTVEIKQSCLTLRKPSSGEQTSEFGIRLHPITGQLKMHHGIDLAAGYGSPITAAAAGKVVYVGDEEDGYGTKIIIQHQLDESELLETLYAHLSEVHVQVGGVVDQGEIIGLEGTTGFSTGSHLHFEVRLGGEPKNPLDFIDRPFGKLC